MDILVSIPVVTCTHETSQKAHVFGRPRCVPMWVEAIEHAFKWNRVPLSQIEPCSLHKNLVELYLLPGSRPENRLMITRRLGPSPSTLIVNQSPPPGSSFSRLTGHPLPSSRTDSLTLLHSASSIVSSKSTYTLNSFSPSTLYTRFRSSKLRVSLR